MKAILAGLLTLCVVVGLRAEDVIVSAPAPHVNRHVSINLVLEGATNTYEVTASEPFEITSLYVETTNAIDVTMSVVRWYDFQEVKTADVTVTNILGLVETIPGVVTNITYQEVEIPLVTLSNQVLTAVTVPLTIKANDKLKFVQTSTNAYGVVVSGRR
jgi:hypothetical protein